MMKTIPNVPLKNQDDWAEFRGQVVDILEDMLADKDATIDNDDRNEAIEDGEDEDGLAIIYSSDYDVIGDEAENCITDGQLNTAAPTLTFDQVADRIMDAYAEIYGKAEFPGNSQFTQSDRTILRQNLITLLHNWQAGK